MTTNETFKWSMYRNWYHGQSLRALRESNDSRSPRCQWLHFIGLGCLLPQDYRYDAPETNSYDPGMARKLAAGFEAPVREAPDRSWSGPRHRKYHLGKYRLTVAPQAVQTLRRARKAARVLRQCTRRGEKRRPTGRRKRRKIRCLGR